RVPLRDRARRGQGRRRKRSLGIGGGVGAAAVEAVGVEVVRRVPPGALTRGPREHPLQLRDKELCGGFIFIMSASGPQRYGPSRVSDWRDSAMRRSAFEASRWSR